MLTTRCTRRQRGPPRPNTGSSGLPVPFDAAVHTIVESMERITGRVAENTHTSEEIAATSEAVAEKAVQLKTITRGYKVT